MGRERARVRRRRLALRPGRAGADRQAGAYPASILLFATAVGVVAVAPTIWVAAGGDGRLGDRQVAAAVVANVTFVQRGAPDRLRGRAFTVIMSVNYLVLGAAMVVAGPLTDRVGARGSGAAARCCSSAPPGSARALPPAALGRAERAALVAESAAG